MKKILTCKDHTVSGEQFSLLYDPEYDMLVTHPKPDVDTLSSYYKSDAYISHTDANRSLFDKLYHFVKNITLRKKIKLLNSFSLSGKKLLDVGCGTGAFLQIAQKNHWEVIGVEPNKKAKQIAETKLSNNTEIFLDIDLLSKSYPKNTFDVITLWHVLEHISDLHKYISQLKQLLKQDGVLIIAVPNYKSYDAIYYKEYWAAYDVPRHLWHFSKNSIEKIFSKHQMKLVKSLPMKFDAFYISLLSEKYKTGKQNLFISFIIGCISNSKAKRSGEYSSLLYLLKNK